MSKIILVVEDDTLVAMMLEGYLDALDHKMVGPFESVAPALAHVNPKQIDMAVVDIHLASGETSAPIARALRSAGIPFIIVTGSYAIVTDPAFDGATILEKPFTIASLEASLAALDQSQDRLDAK